MPTSASVAGDTWPWLKHTEAVQPGIVQGEGRGSSGDCRSVSLTLHPSSARGAVLKTCCRVDPETHQRPLSSCFMRGPVP